MTKAEAKRWVCGQVAAKLGADTNFVEETGETLSDEDQRRVDEALEELIAELWRRSR